MCKLLLLSILSTQSELVYGNHHKLLGKDLVLLSKWIIKSGDEITVVQQMQDRKYLTDTTAVITPYRSYTDLTKTSPSSSSASSSSFPPPLPLPKQLLRSKFALPLLTSTGGFIPLC